MSTFKKQIESALLKNDWEIVLVDSKDDWWLEEYWVVQSTKRGFPSSLVIYFEEDPMSFSAGDNNSTIWSIKAAQKLPDDRMDKEACISELSLTTRKFNAKLEQFIIDINDFRK